MHRVTLALLFVASAGFIYVIREDLQQTMRKHTPLKPVRRVRHNFSHFPVPPPESCFENPLPAINAHTVWTNFLNHPVPELDQPAGNIQLLVMGPLGPLCKSLEIYGSGDGEKRACGLKTATDCSIISVGSNNQWDFEEAVFDQLNCTVETFDCTVNAQVPPRIASRTRFHPFCISGEDRVDENNRVYLAWPSIMRMINAKKAPDYLKMDIEEGEYDALPRMLKDGFFMPRQIAFEIHVWKKTLREVALFMESLYVKGGYFFIDQRPNPGCRECTEVLVSRVDI